MGIVLDIVLPVFGILMLGFAATRIGLVDAAAIRGLSLFAFNFAIPFLLFRSMALAELPEQMPWDFLATYYLATFTLFGLGMLTAKLAFSRRLDEQGIFGLAASFSNTTLLGIPLVLTTFGQAASLPLFLLIAFHSLLVLPLATLVVEIGRGEGAALRQIARQTLKGMVTNPLLVGLVTGLGFRYLDFGMPGLVDSITKTIGAAATPCALFAMGGTLSQHRIAGGLAESLSLVVLKIIVQPLLVWVLVTFVFELEPLWAAVAVLMAALPAGVNVYLYAQRYNICVPTATSTVFLSSVASSVTLSALLFWLQVR